MVRAFDAFGADSPEAESNSDSNASPNAGATHDVAIDRALLRFQWDLLVDAGYEPRVDIAVDGAVDAGSVFAFSPRDGTLARDRGEPGHWRVRRETAVLLASLANARRDAPPGGVPARRRVGVVHRNR